MKAVEKQMNKKIQNIKDMKNKWTTGTMLFELERLNDFAKENKIELPNEVKCNLAVFRAMDKKHKAGGEVFVFEPTALDLAKEKVRRASK